MATDNNHKNVWFTNQQCEVAGTYSANHCNIRFEINYKTGEKFVRCPACAESIEWTLTKRD